MTEKDLLESQAYDGDAMTVQVTDLKEFLKEHVCIKKGENRHPFANVMHEWIEGADMQEKLTNWCNTLSCLAVYGTKELRIKPPEPKYEWQWLFFSGNGPIAFVTDMFYTEDEAKKGLTGVYVKIEETKRERK